MDMDAESQAFLDSFIEINLKKLQHMSIRELKEILKFYIKKKEHDMVKLVKEIIKQKKENIQLTVESLNGRNPNGMGRKDIRIHDRDIRGEMDQKI